jgi:hypothetical protein
MIDTSFVGRVESSDRSLFLVVVIGVVQHRRDSRAILTDSIGYGHLVQSPILKSRLRMQAVVVGGGRGMKKPPAI